MKLCCVAGNTSTAVLSEQIKLIGKKLDLGRKQIVIVPDRFSVSMERLLLERLNLEASFNIEVVSFMRLAYLCLPSGYERDVLNPLGSAMIVQMLVRRHASELKLFKHASSAVGFSTEIARTIASFKSSGITVEQAHTILIGQKVGLNPDKMHDIVLLYSKYEEYVKTRYIDTNNRMDVLEKNIATSNFFDNSDVHLCCFNDLTTQGFGVLKELISRAGNVSVGVLKPLPEQKNKSVYYQDFYHKIAALGAKIKAGYTEVVANSALVGDRKFVLENLFSYPNPSYSGNKNASFGFYKAAHPKAEVELLARFVKEHIVNGGRYSEVSVACASLDSYAPIIESVFRQFEIPFYSDIDIPLTATAVYRLCESAINVVAKNYRQADFFNFAKNTLSGAERSKVCRLELLAMKFGLEGNRLIRPLSETLPKGVSVDAELEAIRDGLVSPLLAFGKNLKGASAVGDICSAILRLTEGLNVNEKLDALSVKFLQEGKLKQESVARQSGEKLRLLVDQISQVLEKEEMNVADFNLLFGAGAASVGIMPLPMSADSVFVGQINSSVFMESELVWVLGATADAFPSCLQDVGLISDREMSVINNKFALAPSVRQTNRLAKQNALELLTLGTRRLCMSCPEGVKGAEVTPSSAYLQCAKSLGVRIVSAEDIYASSLTDASGIERAFTLSATAPALRRFSYELRAQADGAGMLSPDAGSVRELLLLGKHKSVTELVLKNILGSQEMRALPNANEAFFKDNAVRVTEVERYFECPYKHFVDYGLRLADNKTSKVEAMDVGNILHRVAELFVVQNKDKVLSSDKVELAANKVFDGTLAEQDFRRFVLDAKNEFVLAQLRTEAVRLCGAINYQNTHSAFKPILLEASFGQSESLPEFKLAVLGKDITVRGKLDRADKWKGKYRLIDYKTGRASAKFSLVDLYLGKKLQLFIYLHALTANTTNTAGGAYYFPIINDFITERGASEYARFKLLGVAEKELDTLLAQDDQVEFEHPSSDIIPFDISISKENVDAGEIKVNHNNAHLSGVEFKACLNYARSVFTGALAEIMEGYIEPSPLSGECEYCAYRGICRVELKESASERSKSFSVKAGAFTEIAERINIIVGVGKRNNDMFTDITKKVSKAAANNRAATRTRKESVDGVKIADDTI